MISTWADIKSWSSPSNTAAAVLATTVIATNVLLVVNLNLGLVRIGQTVETSLGVPLGTTITGFLTGLGGIGTYTMSNVAGVGAGTGVLILS